jgi:hypothetical protein
VPRPKEERAEPKIAFAGVVPATNLEDRVSGAPACDWDESLLDQIGNPGRKPLDVGDVPAVDAIPREDHQGKIRLVLASPWLEVQHVERADAALGGRGVDHRDVVREALLPGEGLLVFLLAVAVSPTALDGRSLQ